MKQNRLYLLSEQYYTDFPDPKLMRNKEYADGQPHNRPYFLAFKDKTNSKISWLVPISSKVDKFRKEERKKIGKYGRCNTIRFGTVLNRDAAFLIQNMFPVTDKYITAYVDRNQQPIAIRKNIAADIEKNAYEVLNIAKRHPSIILPKVFDIYASLVEEITNEKTIEISNA